MTVSAFKEVSGSDNSHEVLAFRGLLKHVLHFMRIVSLWG